MARAVERYDTLVVGAGFAGAVLAERLASRCGQRVCVIDERSHVGGIAHDHVDEAGVLCHRYGPHIFHTRAPAVWQYLSRFTEWRPYEHRVLASIDGRLLPFPVNRRTVNELYGLQLSDEREMRAFLDARAEPPDVIRTSEDVVLSKLGRDLYERFFRGYTRKHWALDPSELDASVCARIPVRFDEEDRWSLDPFQRMPRDGYTALFERLLDHPGIDVRLGTSFEEADRDIDRELLVYTGPIDRYFGHRLGALPYRSVEFELQHHHTPDGGLVQPVAQLNFPSEDVPHTRTTEYRHLTGQEHDWSTIAVEHPVAEGEPCYPVPRPENRELYGRYRRLATHERGVVFVGRLARYQYLDMDQVVGQALATFARLRRAGAVAEAREAA
jgi:UDP-galactopyranose mutase